MRSRFDLAALPCGPAADVLTFPDFALSENGYRLREVFGGGELADSLAAEPTEQAADFLRSDEVHALDYTLTVDTRQASSRMGVMTNSLPGHPLPLIGRERVLIDKLTKSLHDEARRHGSYTLMREVPRGNWFEVELADGRVARVEVTLSRVLDESERTHD